MADQSYRRRLLWSKQIIAMVVMVIGCSLGTAATANAYTGINLFSVETSSTQAGGHPDVDIHMNFNNREVQNSQIVPPAATDSCDCQDVERIDVHFPTGFIGNPHAVGECTLDEMSNHICPSDSQVGIVEVSIATLKLFGQKPLYNMEPHPDEPGLLAFEIPFLGVPSFIALHGRTGNDYGLDSSAIGIVHTIPVNALDIHLWGVPGDKDHDLSRLPSPQGGCPGTYPTPCPGTPIAFNGTPAPYLENPTSCGESLSAGLDLSYYDGTHVHADAPYSETTGCDLLSFNPSLTVAPTTGQADSPSGLDFDLRVPQAQNPNVPSPSEIKATTVTFPKGFAINPNAADGKTSCSNEQAALGTELAAQCPENSKIGTMSLDSSALPGPIEGAVYLGQPLPDDRYRVLLTADGFSTHVKLSGSIYPDPQTGQLVTSFTNLPQSPFQDFNLHIFGSERGMLVTPTECGVYEVNSEFMPWDSALSVQHSVSKFTIDSGPNGTACPGQSRPFAPKITAGGPDNTAGVHSPFSLLLTRQDGEQNVTGLSVTTPPGFSASLAGIPYCPQTALDKIADPNYLGLSELAVSACPEASRIGVAIAGVGAGSHQLYVPGKVYLAGPYKGAPLSLEVVLPAVSGPYDLGNVAVRAAIEVNPVTAQVTTASDPLPQILDGIPLRARSIQVDLDRPGFILNPTNCDPFSIATTILGDQGGVASPSAGFQVANCAGLPYKPKLRLRLTGGLNRLGHPAIHSVFTAAGGEANTRRVSVALPAGELLDNAHVGNICTKVQFAARACPASSIIGAAEAMTPLLSNPLKGSVYLRSSSEGLPNLVADLRGQLDVELVGRIDTVHDGALRTTFESVPDVPVSSFKLNLAGGSKGLLQNSEALCGRSKKAVTRMVGQNGATLNTKTDLEIACHSNGRHKRHTKQNRHRES